MNEPMDSYPLMHFTAIQRETIEIALMHLIEGDGDDYIEPDIDRLCGGGMPEDLQCLIQRRRECARKLLDALRAERGSECYE